MPELRYLARDEVAGLLPSIVDQVDLVEQTYRSMAAGKAELPPKPGVHPRENSFIHAMPAYLADSDVAAVKWVGGFPANKERGIPYISGVIVVNDGETGFPIGIMDAAEITAARTAAASGVCVRRWAHEGWARAAILGCGEQGRYHAAMLRALNPEATIVGYDVVPERMAALGSGSEQAGSHIEAVAGADVVVSAAPIVENADAPLGAGALGERWLGLPLDFDAYFSRELVASADVFLTDDVGQFEAYRGHGYFKEWPKPNRSVGQALTDDGSGEMVLCCNLGVGALDAAFGKAVLEQAHTDGIGTLLQR
ncbi:MAG: hypothetical protein ACR2OD_02130 [Gaiellaceae bacterium]